MKKPSGAFLFISMIFGIQAALISPVFAREIDDSERDFERQAEAEMPRMLLKNSEPLTFASDRAEEMPFSALPSETLATPENDLSSARVNFVHQLRDVRPSDWAYAALQSLGERYNCLDGYPDGTYRGQRTLTRYEFAVGLNKCIGALERLAIDELAEIGQTDLETVQRLRDDFASELAELETTVENLETRTTVLEQQQFSTTTKLGGQVLAYFGDAFGENAGPANNTLFGYRARLSFNSSFTGKDSLLVRVQGTNLRRLDTATEFPQGRLSGATNETRFLGSGISGTGDVSLNGLRYRFPIGDKLRVSLDAFSNDRVLTDLIGPFASSSTGAISYFGTLNPILYPIFIQSGINVQWDVAPWLNLDFSVGSEFGSSDNPEIGLLEGGYGTSVRSVFDFDALRFSFIYIHLYSLNSGVDTFSGSNAARVRGAGPVVGNVYGSAIAYEVSPRFQLGASLGLINARTLGDGTRGDARVFDHRFFLAFRDLGKEGNLGGIVFGMQPRLTATSNPLLAEAIGLPPGQRSDRDAGFHLEAFYTHRITNNIAITPGFLWLSAPNHDTRNPDVFMGVIRTSFTF